MSFKKVKTQFLASGEMKTAPNFPHVKNEDRQQMWRLREKIVWTAYNQLWLVRPSPFKLKKNS